MEERINIFYLTLCLMTDLSKLKGFADNNISMIKMIKYDLYSCVTIVGKEENTGYLHFLLSPAMFSTDFFSKVIKGLKQNATKLMINHLPHSDDF